MKIICLKELLEWRKTKLNTKNHQAGYHLYYLNEEYIGLYHNQGFTCSTEMCRPTWAKMCMFSIKLIKTFQICPLYIFFYGYISVKLMITKWSSVTLKKCICDKDEMTVNKASDTELQQDRIKQKV